MREQISCIYAIISPSNRAYIGSTKDFYKRRTQHLYRLRTGTHGCDAMKSAYAKYGASNLTFEILERCDVADLINREQWWIDNHLTKFGRMYNSSSIAGRPEHTPEVRAKISASQKGRKTSEETRLAHSVRMTGTKHTEETKAKMRQSSIKTDAKDRLIAMNKSRAGRVTSEETKEKLRLIKRGRKLSEAHKAAMREGQRRRYERDGGISEDAKAKISAHRGRKNRPRTPEEIAESQAKRKATREANGSNKITDAQADIIRTSGDSAAVLAEKYGLHPTTIYAIKRGTHRRVQ